MFITYCWSQVRPSRVLWKMSRRPSWLKYASAFSPPLVSCLMLRRCCSPGSAAITCGADCAGSGTAHDDAATSVATRQMSPRFTQPPKFYKSEILQVEILQVHDTRSMAASDTNQEDSGGLGGGPRGGP